MILLICFLVALLIQLLIIKFNYTVNHGATIAHTVDDSCKYSGYIPLYEQIDKKWLQGWESKDNKTIDYVRRASTLLPRIKRVVKIDNPTSEMFRDYIAPVGVPVVMRGLITKMVLTKWTWGYIKTKYGHIKFDGVRQGEYTGEKTKTGKNIVKRVSITLRDFVDVIINARESKEQEKQLYIAKKDLITSEDFAKEFNYPPFFSSAEKCFLPPSIWMGALGTYTQGHFDSKDNFVYQIIGRKKWYLYSPQDHNFLYFVKNKGTLEWSSALDSLDKPSIEKYPLYKYSNLIEVILEPGEVLYLPRGWVHAVENLEPAFMINLWKLGPAEILKYWSASAEKEIKNLCEA